MARPGGQEERIPCRKIDLPAALPAQEKPCLPSRHSERFVAIAVIMMEIIDAVAPLRRPTITGEAVLDHGCRIPAARRKGCRIDQHRQPWIVRDETALIEP